MQEDWVLCRVFQKKKGDNEQDTASPTSHTPVGSYNPMVNQSTLMNDFCDQISLGFPTEALHQVGGGASNTFLSMPMFQHECNIFDTAYEFNSAAMMGLNSKAACGSSTGTNDHGIYYDMTSNLDSTWYPLWQGQEAFTGYMSEFFTGMIEVKVYDLDFLSKVVKLFRVGVVAKFGL